MTEPWRVRPAVSFSLKPFRSSAWRHLLVVHEGADAARVRLGEDLVEQVQPVAADIELEQPPIALQPRPGDGPVAVLQIRIVHSSSRPSCWRSPQVTSPTCHCARTPSSRRCSRASSCIAAMISGVSRTYEELEVGAVYRSRFGRTVLEADNVWFTLLTLNTNPIHFDAEYAATTEWERPLVDSTFTLALVTGLSVADVSERGVNLGWKEVRLPAPVFVGDTISAETEVLGKRESKSRPGYGIVTVRTRGLNQRDEAVIEFERSIMLPL